MVISNLTFSNIELTHPATTLPLDITQRVIDGEVMVLRKCMQAIGYFKCLQEASLEAICRATDEEKAAKVRALGFESIHSVINLDELGSVVHSGYDIFHEIAPELARKIVKDIFQQKVPFYLEESPNVRFHVPYDVVVKKKEEFNRFEWNGKVTSHGPHHDSWYYCPTNCINIWIALSAVKIGNGLSIYPEVYGKRLPCTEDGKIQRNQYFGDAINFELEPGDALIFHGEHLHASEINSTNLTRHVASLRITLEKPNFLGRSPYQYDYIYLDPNNNLSTKVNQFLAKISRRVAVKIDSFFNRSKEIHYVISPSEVENFDDLSENFPAFLPTQTIKEEILDASSLPFDTSQLETGTIRPLSKKLCVARLDRERIVVFSRYCPHEGADLAAGYLRGDCVVCPWHNLPFNLNDGASPCQSLPKLTILQSTDGIVEDELDAEINAFPLNCS